MLRSFLFCLMIILICLSCKNESFQISSDEKFRPVYHFTPDSMWMNDPNGMVYFEGEYHLFYQYYPDSNVWGPMHWGHAVSKDMIIWEHLPIALYPDSLGYIFSGSAVIDWKNTSGFGEDGHPPMIAIFTHHSEIGEKAGRDDFQNQSLAYSNDKGRTWLKYSNNPVIKNDTGIRDFRDPKVIWHKESELWVMVLAAKDKVMFYNSPDLKNWQYVSEYGLKNDPRLWECPDLFPMIVEGTDEVKWVLVVSIQSGAPNGGTGTAYFVGDFDGKKFINSQADQKQYWLDYGTDNYAMVSWSDIPVSYGRRLMLGWMSNWLYAQSVPTQRWRSAMTLPREIQLHKTGETEWMLKSRIVKEFAAYRNDTMVIEDMNLQDNSKIIPISADQPHEIHFSFIKSSVDKDLKFLWTNDLNDSLWVGFDRQSNQWFIDRTKAGISEFYEDFAAKHFAPCQSKMDTLSMHFIFDRTSVELFADDGLTVMTDIFFPNAAYKKVEILKKGYSDDFIHLKCHQLQEFFKY